MTDEIPRLPTRRPLSSVEVDPLPPCRFPARTALSGQWVTLEPLDPQTHAADLFGCAHADATARAIWRFLPYGPFADSNAFNAWLRECAAAADPVFFAVRDHATRQAAGMLSCCNIRPAHGVLEIGHVWFAPLLQRTRQSSEALMLLLRYAMDDLRCRRLEWKCDALNLPSRNAAQRLGFSFEGIFYNHMVMKGRNRDTAWFSLLDSEWPAVGAAFAAWLAPDNFDAAGRQQRPLRISKL